MPHLQICLYESPGKYIYHVLHYPISINISTSHFLTFFSVRVLKRNIACQSIEFSQPGCDFHLLQGIDLVLEPTHALSSVKSQGMLNSLDFTLNFSLIR